MTASRTYPARPIVSVSLAVFRAGKVLVATRVTPPLVNMFSLPGGVVELGEKLQEAALRELMEEVQVEARIIGFNRHIEMVDRDAEGRVRHHFIIANFVAEWVSGEGTPGPEAGEVRWSDEAELAGLPVTPNLIAIIAQARKVLRNNL